MGIRAEPEG